MTEENLENNATEETPAESSDGNENSSNQDTSANADADADADANADANNEADTSVDSDSKTVDALPDNWRDIIAGEDEKLGKLLSKYNSASDVVKALDHAQRKISQGTLKLSDNPTDEELAEYRKQMGVPEKHEEYDINDLGEGLVIGDEDKPMVDEYLKAMHGTNATPDQVKAGLKTYLTLQQQATDGIYENDIKAKDEAESMLKKEWGAEYKNNIERMSSLLDLAPAEIAEDLKYARLANGKPMFSDANAIRWLADIATKVNPIPKNMLGSSEMSLQSAEKMLGEYQQRMSLSKDQARDKGVTYWYDDKESQEMYAKLVDFVGRNS